MASAPSCAWSLAHLQIHSMFSLSCHHPCSCHVSWLSGSRKIWDFLMFIRLVKKAQGSAQWRTGIDDAPDTLGWEACHK